MEIKSKVMFNDFRECHLLIRFSFCGVGNISKNTSNYVKVNNSINITHYGIPRKDVEEL